MPKGESWVVEVYVTEARAGLRLDQVLATHDKLSRGAARRLIGAGAVWVDGKRVKVAGRKVRSGQRVVAYLDPPASPATERTPSEPLDLQSRIVFADDRMIVVDKPAGMLSASTQRRDTGVLSTELERQLGLKSAPIPVNRLDRDTSGLMVLALNREAASRLTEVMMQKATRKEYRAVCRGRPEEDRGVWDWPLGPDRRRVARFRVAMKKGKAARTGFEVLGKRAELEGAWEMQFALFTGRTHQIRVHALHAGCPVVGDPWYGRVLELRNPEGEVRRVRRLFLHSFRFSTSVDGWPGNLDLQSLPDWDKEKGTDQQ